MAWVSSARAPLRRISVRESLKAPGWVSLITLLSDTAYHSFIGEVEALNTTTITPPYPVTPSPTSGHSSSGYQLSGSVSRPVSRRLSARYSCSGFGFRSRNAQQGCRRPALVGVDGITQRVSLGAGCVSTMVNGEYSVADRCCRSPAIAYRPQYRRVLRANVHARISWRCYFSLATKTPRHWQPGGSAAKKAMRSSYKS